MAFVLQFYCSYGVHKSECRGLKGRNRLKSPLIRLYSRLFFVIHGCGREAMKNYYEKDIFAFLVERNELSQFIELFKSVCCFLYH